MKPGLASLIETHRPFGITLPYTLFTEMDSELETFGEVGSRLGQSGERIRVLLVESRISFAKKLAQRITRWGIWCDIAYNTSAALQIAAWHHPQVVMIQLERPSRDASQLVQQLRAKSKGSDILFVGYAQFNLLEEWRSKPHFPFDLILTNPIQLSFLRSLLMLEKRHSSKISQKGDSV